MAEFVSFRPGKLLPELSKRGSSLTTIAKRHLEMHFKFIEGDLRTLQRSFTSLEMRFLFCVLHGAKDVTLDTLVHSYDEIACKSSTFSTLAAKYDIASNTMTTKLSKLSDRQAFALIDAIEQFRQEDLTKVMAGFLPKTQVLQRIGVIAADGPAAWGLCVIRIKGFFVELVLRITLDDMGDLKEDTWKDDDLIDTLVKYAEIIRIGEPPDKVENQALRVAYALSRKTGHQRYVIIADKDDTAPSVREIKAQWLVDDLYTKTQEHIVLSGVNAP